MMKTRIVTVLAIVFALVAAVLSHKLLVKHATGKSDSAWFEAGCNETDETTSGCSAVLASDYSVWPPKKTDEPANTPHLPIALMGLVYYSMMAVWLIGVGAPSRNRRWVHLFPVGMVGFGLCGSVYFIYIMATVIDEWCPWCMVTHVLNLGLAICVLLLWPRVRLVSGTTEQRAGAKAPTEVAPAHPSLRLVLATLIGVVSVAMVEDGALGRRQCARDVNNAKLSYRACVQALAPFKRSPSALAKTWEDNPVHQIAIRPDDPIRRLQPGQPDPLELVVFSDFACPSCKRLSAFLEADVASLFAGNLRIVFKHFPLNSDCNPMTTTRKHTNACTAARLAEAARIVGGNDAFWRAHDYLFEHQDQLNTGKLTIEAVAVAIGLDHGRIVETMASESITQRIRQDAEHGRSYGVAGTPSLYLRGRRVDPVVRGEMKFWNKIADDYWKDRNMPRPAATKLPVESVTRDTQGQPVGP